MADIRAQTVANGRLRSSTSRYYPAPERFSLLVLASVPLGVAGDHVDTRVSANSSSSSDKKTPPSLRRTLDGEQKGLGSLF